MERIKKHRTLEVIKTNTMTVQLKFTNLTHNESKQTAIIMLIYELEQLKRLNEQQLNSLTTENKNNGFYLKVKIN